MSTGVDTLVLNRKIAVKNGQPLLLSNCDAMTLMRADQDGPRDDIAHDPPLATTYRWATQFGRTHCSLKVRL